MTYCLAWKSAGHGYLITDTLTAGHAPAIDATSSVGERHREIAVGIAQESIIKLVQLRPGTLCAFAGDVEMAYSIIDFMKDNITTEAAIVDLFESVTASFSPFDRTRNVELLIVDSSENGDVSVYRWASTIGRLESGSNYYQIGSADQHHRDLTEVLMSGLLRYAREPFSPLYVAIAWLQTSAAHFGYFERGIGGIVCGARVHAGQTHWQEDTVTAFIGAGGGYVATLFRDELLAVNSTYSERGRVFAPYPVDHQARAKPRAAEWHDRWAREFLAFVPAGFAACRSWIFISRDQPVFTVLLALRAIVDAHEYMRPTVDSHNFSPMFTNRMTAIVTREISDRARQQGLVDDYAIVVHGR